MSRRRFAPEHRDGIAEYYVTFQIAGRACGLNVMSVPALVDPAPRGAPGRGFLWFGERCVRVVDLAARGGTPTPVTDRTAIVLLESRIDDGCAIGLLSDRVLDVLSVDRRSIGPAPEDALPVLLRPFVVGVGGAPDGPFFVLDPERLLAGAGARDSR